jgi:hypothetical protein
MLSDAQNLKANAVATSFPLGTAAPTTFPPEDLGHRGVDADPCLFHVQQMGRWRSSSPESGASDSGKASVGSWLSTDRDLD